MATKDELRDLFQERFTGHEVPVDPGTWSVISSQLAAGAGSTSSLEEMFRERFSGHEADVPPGAWEAISGQLGQGAAGGAASGWGAMAGWATAGIAVLVTVGGLMLWSQQDEKPLAIEPIAAVSPMPVEEKQGSDGTAVDPPAAVEVPAVIAPRPVPREQKQGGTERTEEAPAANDPADPVANAPVGEQIPSPDLPAESRPETTGIEVVQQVVSTLAAEVDHEPLKPATVPDPMLEEEEMPVQAPENFGNDGPATFHLYLPNVFTPNNDGYNDVYLPQGEGITGAIVRVYSLTGNELVFRADALIPWDGTNLFTGQVCPEGHYLYAIEAMGTDGQAHTEGQTVRLLREFR